MYGLGFYANIGKKVDVMKDLKYEQVNEYIVTTNKEIIDQKVKEKYKEMLRDNGIKNEIKHGKKYLNFTAKEIREAVENVDFSKATSWDYIPGISIKGIILDHKEENTFYKNLAVYYNQLMNDNEKIDEELICSRLLCLNKEASEPGNLENIRPISIFGPLVKIMEKVILVHLMKWITNNKIICKKQTGFIPRLGCEVNLARIRQRTYDVLNNGNPEEKKYMLFIDLKNAYDSVDHEILFRKLRELKAPEEIVNTIAKIYSNAKMRIDPITPPLNVNRGVLQGSVLSPMLFNIYINDLIAEIDKKCFEILAYADDIAIICKDLKELNIAMDLVENWGKSNKVIVNKKKSGIFILNRRAYGEDDNIRGYPLKNWYKYLGITMNYNLDPTNHLYV